MKACIIISLAMLCLVTTTYAQKKDIICCGPTATEKFAMNAGDKSFQLFHLNPKPFKFHADRGHDINIKTSDGAEGHGWEVKAKHKTEYFMLVFHEWWGLNDYIKQECETLSNDLDINVIAVDLYDNKVAANSEDAARYTQQVKTERANAVIKGRGDASKLFSVYQDVH